MTIDDNKDEIKHTTKLMREVGVPSSYKDLLMVKLEALYKLEYIIEDCENETLSA